MIQPRRWAVYTLKRKAERFPFSVQARDSAEAIERAVKEFEIPQARPLAHLGFSARPKCD